MVSSVSSEPYQIYFDTCALLDLADSKRARHKQAQKVLRLLQKYKPTGELNLLTSAWAIAEAQGVLYGDKLTRNGITHPRRKNVRNIIPPVVTELTSAKGEIDTLLLTLQRSVNFTLWTPTPADSAHFWSLVIELGHEAAIWPNDSIHLASALLSGCSMFVTDDADFLDKVDYCNPSFITPFRNKEFSHVLATLPQFQCHGIEFSNRMLASGRSNQRRHVKQELGALGFK